VLAPIPFIDVLDHLLAPVGFDVDIDVGRPISFGRQEPFEQQPEGNRIGVGDAECVTHRGVRRRASPLTQDVRPVTELDDVGHDEEVTGEPEVVD